LGEVAHVLNFEPCTKLGFERCKPCGIIAGCGNVIDVQCDNGEYVTGAEDVDARVGDALLPPVVDEPCTEQHVELARGLLDSVEAALEMTQFGRAITEAEGLADVHVLLNRGGEKRSVDVQLTQLEVAAAAMARKRRRLAMRMIGENVSVKSSPARWLHPLATKRALKREISPAVSDLTL
jgi:hypothetical protein